MIDGSPAKLAGKIGLFDATMLVMGGMVGAGIFMNPYVVAQRVHSPVLMLGGVDSRRRRSRCWGPLFMRSWVIACRQSADSMST